MRQSYQVLIIPYIKEDKEVLYATFLCNGDEYWAPITGGGEDNETVFQSAIREAWEEGAIAQPNDNWIKLDSISSIPRDWIDKDAHWSKDILVIPEYCFGVLLDNKDIKLSNEHSRVEWLSFDEAIKRYRYDAHKIALWELNERLIK